MYDEIKCLGNEILDILLKILSDGKSVSKFITRVYS